MIYVKCYEFFYYLKFYIIIFWCKFLIVSDPNKIIIGTSARPIICITPLSIVIARSSLAANAVTKAGQDNSDLISGNKADGT